MLHIFYDVSGIDFLELQNEAIKDVDSIVKLNKLDCSESFTRQQSDKSYEQICEIYINDPYKHQVFIVRNYDFLDRRLYIELGVRTTDKTLLVDYFTFIELPIDRLDYYVAKYNLTEVNI